MRNGLLLCLAVVALSIPSIGRLQSDEAATGNPDGSETLDRLLNQRRETLRQLVTLTTDQYRAGRGSIDAVVRTSDQLMMAELDVTDDRSERLDIYTQRGQLLKDAEEMTQARFQTGNATQQEVLLARAARLEAEIELLREQTLGRQDD